MTMSPWSPDEMAEKLAIIATLTRHELDGYQDAARTRGYFPGEARALAERRAKL
ncbi:hypothetical protein [Falsirhodobacter halotolerans]|uniref:hypothetical protein n=1 Tax=Falsirhodobacter halotolerans TaxID=1146892 RepID=UPI001FD39296|nr:hypothetical protein [Falsirhodobacter halotolerans]MCJ8138582.1 hypothetical protein [Falsirhodobacter halotolerans]